MRTKYRIQERRPLNGEPFFVPQRRVFFLWFDCGYTNEGRGFTSVAFPNFGEARLWIANKELSTTDRTGVCINHEINP